jgi:hypothetical protein
MRQCGETHPNRYNDSICNCIRESGTIFFRIVVVSLVGQCRDLLKIEMCGGKQREWADGSAEDDSTLSAQHSAPGTGCSSNSSLWTFVC